MGMLSVWWLLLNTNRGQMADPVGDWDAFLAQLPVNRLDEILGFSPIPAFRKALDQDIAADRKKENSVVAGLDSSGVRMLFGVGWFDAFAAGSMKDASRLIELNRQRGTDNFRVIAGPWGHGLCENSECGELDFGPDSLIDLKGLQNAFVAQSLRGTPLPPELEKPVLYFLMGANEWKQAESWPPDECEDLSLYLDSKKGANSRTGDGSLFPGPASGSDSDSYDYNPLDPVPSIGGASLFLHAPAGPMDQRLAEQRDDVLCYTGGILDKPLTFVGIPKAEIYVETSVVDTDFFVRLCDVYPDGRSMLICDGGLRLACREGLDKHVPAVPGECYKLQIELASTAIRIPAGHQIRIEITSSCSPRFVRNLNSAKHPCEECEEDAVIAKQTIHHSVDRPSRITLPVIDS